MSLQSCINKALQNKATTKEVTRALEDEAIKLEQQYLKEGIDPIEARTRAASDAINNLLDQSRTRKTKILENTQKALEKELRLKNINFDKEDEGLAYINENVAKYLGGLEFMRSPIIRSVTDESATIRAMGTHLYENNLITGKNVKGETNSFVAEKEINRDLTKMKIIMDESRQIYANYASGGSRAKAAVGSVQEGKLAREPFLARVADQIESEMFDDAIPEINQVAKMYKGLFNDYGKLLQETGLLKVDELPKGYLTTQWKIKDLRQDLELRGKFIEDIGAHLAKFTRDGKVREVPLTPRQGRLEAEDALAWMLRQGDEQLQFNTWADKMDPDLQALRKREYIFPREIIRPFTSRDAETLVSQYVYKATHVARTHQGLRAMGFDSIGELRAHIKKERDAELSKAKTEKERKAIDDKFQTSDKLAKLNYQTMTLSLRRPSEYEATIKSLLNLQYMRLLGGVTLSSLSEVAMHPFRLGMLNSLKGWSAFARDWKTAKLSTEQKADFNVGIDFTHNNVVDAMTATGHHVKDSRWSRNMDLATAAFSKASLIEDFTITGRRFATQIALADMVRTLQKWEATGKIPKIKQDMFTQAGMTPSDYRAVLKQFKIVDDTGDKALDIVNGSYFVKLDMFDDPQAIKAVQNLIQTQVQSTIVIPGKGDIPFLAQGTIVGKFMYQFKNFMGAATGRVTVSGLQRRDATVALGVLQLAFMGIVSGVVKDSIAGRDISDDPVELLMDGISRSGIMGLVATTLLDTANNYAYGNTSRYGLNLASTLLGPTVGMAFDIDKTAGAILDGNVTDADKNRARRLVPYNNLFYLDTLFNQMWGKR